MKTNEQILQELKMTLGAIRISRERWLQTLISKMAEAKSYDSNPTDKAAFSAALSSSEVQEVFQNLVNLYGMLGEQSGEFEKSLEGVVAVEQPVTLKAA